MTEFEQLQEQFKANKTQQEKGALAEKLLANPDFRKLIIDDFCRDETVRNMNMAADPGADKDVRADCLNAAYAGGHLKRYLNAQVQMGRTAANQNEQISEVLIEGDADDADDTDDNSNKDAE